MAINRVVAISTLLLVAGCDAASRFELERFLNDDILTNAANTNPVIVSDVSYPSFIRTKLYYEDNLPPQTISEVRFVVVNGINVPCADFSPEACQRAVTRELRRQATADMGDDY